MSYPLDYEGVRPSGERARGRLPGLLRCGEACSKATGRCRAARRSRSSPVRRWVIHSVIVCARAPVEAQRQLVPVECGPLQPPSAALAHARRDRASSALPTPSPGWRDAQKILQPHATAGEEARERREEQRITDTSLFPTRRSAPPPPDGGRTALRQLFLGRLQLMLEVLVLGQLAEQLQQLGTSSARASRDGSGRPPERARGPDGHHGLPVIADRGAGGRSRRSC